MLTSRWISTNRAPRPLRPPLLTMIFAIVLAGLLYLLMRSMVDHHFFSGGH
jgi:hypothetical protein